MTSPTQSDPQVLIVGAGPTGLVLAVWLARAGTRVRIIDKVAEPGTTSRALAVQARTLEFYQQLGMANGVVTDGVKLTSVNLWAHGKHVARAAFDDIGLGMTPYPNVLIFPQDEHERYLIEQLRLAGVEVERPTELMAFEDRGDRVEAQLKSADGSTESVNVKYLVGCDGARSIVRQSLKLGFPGGTYERVFYVADVSLRGELADHELHAAFDEADFILIFPLKGAGQVRLIGTVKVESEHDESLTWDDISQDAMRRMKLTVDKVNWFSTYHVHHRVAEHFRVGRVFLAGDAAHIHSPVGGQGMNTGIGDAVNLAWKLSAVVAGTASPALLDTYQPERIAFARRLVATTDRAFTFVTRNGWIARRVRLNLLPLLLPVLFRINAFRRFMFRAISQTGIEYRASQLSDGVAGEVRGGDRLPWIGHDAGLSGDNFVPLATRAWQVHVYGEASPAVREVCRRRELALHEFSWRPSMQKAGLSEDAAYVIRPDGYVGLADNAGSAEAVGHYLDRLTTHD